MAGKTGHVVKPKTLGCLASLGLHSGSWWSGLQGCRVWRSPKDNGFLLGFLIFLQRPFLANKPGTRQEREFKKISAQLQQGAMVVLSWSLIWVTVYILERGKVWGKLTNQELHMGMCHRFEHVLTIKGKKKKKNPVWNSCDKMYAWVAYGYWRLI